MKYNKLTGRIDIVKKLWWNEEVCKLDDDGRTYFYYFFERYYKLTSEKCMDKALRIEANSRAYHPICEYLEQLEWDGQERIRYVLQRYMGADASDFVYEVVKHFLMEALSRIYRPGCKADEMLCLVGQQGAGKSTFFRFLALNDAINMFYKQIILQRGLPFEVKMPSARPVDVSALSEAQMNAELEKGYADMQAGHTRSAKSVFADIRKDYSL